MFPDLGQLVLLNSVVLRKNVCEAMADWYSYCENSSIERQTYRFANLYTTNLAYFEPGANVCLWANWPTANCLVHGIAVE